MSGTYTVTKEQLIELVDAEVDKRVQQREQLRCKRAAEITDVREFIQQGVATAALLLIELIEGELSAPIALRAKIASNWLDRAGYGVITRVIRSSSDVQLTSAEIEAIKQRAASAIADAQGEQVSDLSSKAFMTADDVYFSESGELRTEAVQEPYYEDLPQLPQECKQLTLQEYFDGEHDLTYGCSQRALERALTGYPVSAYQPDVKDLQQNLDYWKWLITQGVSWYGERGSHVVYENRYWDFLTAHPELELKEYTQLEGSYIRW